VLAVGKCCYVAVCSAGQGASAPTGEERGGAYRGGRPPIASSLLFEECRPNDLFLQIKFMHFNVLFSVFCNKEL